MARAVLSLAAHFCPPWRDVVNGVDGSGLQFSGGPSSALSSPQAGQPETRNQKPETPEPPPPPPPCLVPPPPTGHPHCTWAGVTAGTDLDREVTPLAPEPRRCSVAATDRSGACTCKASVGSGTGKHSAPPPPTAPRAALQHLQLLQPCCTSCSPPAPPAALLHHLLPTCTSCSRELHRSRRQGAAVNCPMPTQPPPRVLQFTGGFPT